ncbi:MAG: galactose mutarotase [Treponema sp.]|jgi:aldose 1-epimerase|nr:galactose mutarotase [Treponema sp.]
MITIKEITKKKDETIKEITLNNGIIQINVLNIGAAVTSFKLVEYNHNIVVSYEKTEDFCNNSYYLGAVIGPLAGRTKDGKFTMDGKVYQLELNDNTNHLHGGENALHTQVMDMFYEDDENNPQVIFMKEVNHMTDGYPDVITYVITYKLDGNSLIMNLKAIPNIKSPANMTNHMYFNLGATDTVLDHELTIDADEVMELDETYCPLGERIAVADTAFDFRKGNKIRNHLEKNHPQFKMTNGIDHAYVLNDSRSLTLFEPVSKVALKIKTTADCVVMYCGNFFNEGFVNEKGQRAKNHSAVALETQYFPNGVNINGYEPVFFTKEKPLDITTEYVLKKIK